MDPRLMEMLEKAHSNVSAGKTIGLAIIEILKAPNGDWSINCTYQGQQLCLMAGTTRLAHGLNLGLDQLSS